MLRAGVGYSVANSPATAAAEAAAAALRNAGLRSADAALCFATTAHGGAYPLIMRTVAERAGTPNVAGCSAAGIIADENEIESGAALVVMAIGGVAARRFFIPSLRGRGREVAAELAAIASAVTGPALLCIFADTYNLEPADLFATLSAALPPGIMLAGGGASEDGSIGETFQFCGDTVSSNSVSGLLLSGPITLDAGASLACVPLGQGHRVTAARDNVLIELDGRPAFEVFAEVAGPLAANLRRAMARVFVAIPHEPDATVLVRGNYFVRNIVGASPEQGMLAIGHVPSVGGLIGFALRDAEGSRNDLKSTLGELHGRIVVPPAFGLYFNCVSRGRGLYDIPGHDVAYIRQSIGPVPIAGFFTGFEIGPAGRSPGFLQYSGVLVLAGDRAAANAAIH
jgi:small ligand-binding sensory domain FIST